MPKYIIHVGLTKTGSTHLQASLRALRPELRDAEIEYPNVWWSSPGAVNHVGLFEGLIRHDDRLAGIFERLNNLPRRVILLSCEGFAGLQRPELQRFCQLLQGHPCEIVLYCRRWSDWIPSHWQQSVKGGSAERFPDACGRLLGNPFAPPINFGAMLDEFAAVFGHDCIRLVSYSNVMDQRSDLVKHFCSTVLQLEGIMSPFEGTPFAQQANESAGFQLTELMRCLNEIRDNSPPHLAAANNKALMQLWAKPPFREDVARILHAMEDNVATLQLDDNAPELQALFTDVSSKYLAQLVDGGSGVEIFSRRSKNVRYVRPDYQSKPGVKDSLFRIRGAVDVLVSGGQI